MTNKLKISLFGFVQLAAFVFLLFCNESVLAHAKQESYVWVNVEKEAIVGRVELNANDVRDKLNIDVDEVGATRLEGLLASRETLEQFIRENLVFSDEEGDIPYTFGEPTLFAEGGSYLQFPYTTSRLPSSTEITIKNSMWLVPPYSEQDRFFRSMVVAEYNKTNDESVSLGNVALVFTPNRLTQTLDLEKPGSILEWQDFVWQGILHIGIGLDHILFIVVLLLGAVVKNQGGRWVPVDGFKAAFFNTLKIVTIFTIAHSITLTLAALDFVNVSSAIVETIIALSIIAMALNNLFPTFSRHSWLLIFVFGLFHGLGFASVMGDLQFRVGFLERILIMFNIGVEIGQLIIVVVLLPILFWLRKKAFYQPFILKGLSVVTILIAIWWVLERTGLVAA